MTRTYANASSQRVHRVSKRLHKTCAKPPKTPSSEKSGFVAFFVTIVSNKHGDRNDRGRTSARTNPGRRPMTHPNSGAGWCEPLWYAPQRRAPAGDTVRFRCPNASVHPRRPRAKSGGLLHSTPRSARRTRRRKQRFAGHGEMGDRGPVAPFAASGWEPSLAPTHHHLTLAFSATHNHTTHPKPTDHHDSITSNPASAQPPRAGAAVAKSAASHRG